MPHTPTFLGRSGPRNPLSHTRFLEVCYAYRELHEAFVAAGGTITNEIYSRMLQIESEIIQWEQRSAKLKYEARRQAAYRRRAKGDSNEFALPLPQDPYIPQDPFAEGEDTPPQAPAEIPESTRAALAKFKESRGIAGGAGGATAPDTSTYKASGLV